MSDYTNIIQEINTNIPDNTDQSITALKVRTTLIDMLDAVDDNMTEAIGEISVPTKTSDLTNDSGFITATSLEPFVTKTELSNASYATQSFVDDAISDAVVELNIPTKTSDLTNDSGFITATSLEPYVTHDELNSASYVTEQALSTAGYVTESQLQQAGYVTQSALNIMSYATTNDLNTAISGINVPTKTSDLTNDSGFITASDLSGYATETYVADYVATHSGPIDLSAYVSKVELSNMGYITASDLPDMSSYATLTYLETYYATLQNVSDTANTMQQVLIDANILVTDPETGDLTIQAMASETYVADYVSEHAPMPDLSAYVTKTELSNASYVTQSALNSMSYVTASALSNMSYATTTQVNAKQDALVSGTNIKTINNESLLGSGNINIAGGGSTVTGVTQAQYDAMEQAGTLDPTVLYVITDATGADLSDYVELTYLETYYADKTYVADYVAQHAPTPDLSAYVTKTELSNASYVTESQLQQAGYVTQNALNSMSYVTSSALSNMGYLTSIPSEYVTESELSAKGYITSIPSEYVTESELSGMSYATTSQLANKQDTLVSGTNIKTVNNNSLLGSGNISITSSGNLISEVTQAEYDAMEQAGTLDPDTIYVITDAAPTDLSYYVTKTELSNAGYLTSIPNTYATYAAISNMGYLTSANFIYNSSTNTLTISI